MRNFKKGIAAIAITLAFCGTAQAAPAFGPGTSSIFFQNFENVYRTNAACGPTNATCLAASAQDPAGFRRIDPAVVNNIQVGDVFVGILNIQNIDNQTSGMATYNSAPGDRFTGYFVQQVASLTVPPTHTNPLLGHITFQTTADPFDSLHPGLLQAGEMFALFSGVPSFSSAGTVQSGIALATAGTPWATLGPQALGYAYSHNNPLSDAVTSNVEAFFALNFLRMQAGYNAGTQRLINDVNESEIGGANTVLLCGPGPGQRPIGSVGCTQTVGTSEIEFNTAFPNGESPWMFASNDPFRINVVPEPTTLTLLGLALAGLGLRRRRAA